MKLLKLLRSGGGWLFTWSVIYFVIGMYDVVHPDIDWYPGLQMIWITICGLPLVCPPLARWLNMRVKLK